MSIDDELEAFYNSKQKHMTNKFKREIHHYDEEAEDLFKLTEDEQYLDILPFEELNGIDDGLI